MTRNKIILTIIGLALLFTGLSFYYQGDENLGGSMNSGVSISRGFPVHFYQSITVNNAYVYRDIHVFSFPFMVIDILFYSIIIASFWYIFRRGLVEKKWGLLTATFILALVWLGVDIMRNNDCVGGFPVSFFPTCGGDSDISTSFFYGGLLLDIFFWFCMSAVFISGLKFFASEKIGKWRFIFAPVFIVFLSFWYNTPCGGGFCIFSGRGFPAGYFTDGEWSWILFGADTLAWVLVLYPASWGIMKLINRKQKR